MLARMLRDALRSLFSKPITVKYITKPGEMVPVPDRYRGRMAYDREACIGCLLCIRGCPTGAITVTEEGKVSFSVDKCVFCAQCAELCPRKAINFTLDFEVVAHEREGFIVH